MKPRELQKIIDQREIFLKQIFITRVVALSCAACCIISGGIFMFLGLGGAIEWVLSGAGLSSKLSNAGPGVFLVVVGMAIFYWYRPKGYSDEIKHGNISSKVNYKSTDSS